MSSTTRRRFIQGAAIALAAAPAIRTARAAPNTNRTLRAVMLSDLRSFDPIWTTASISTYHGGMIYDTLFGLDADMRPQPQMVSKFEVSDDKLTYTFELRDGLRFSDGTPVRSRDCIASLRRWGVRDVTGSFMFGLVADTPVKDDKTFRIVLKERFGQLLDSLGKVSTSVPYIMREKEANTDPAQQVTETIGSGPFLFNRDASKMGSSYVYDRNPNYVPRSGPPSGTAGGKVVKLDRVIWDNMTDEQTALAALQNGEIDFYEMPPLDLIDQLEQDHNIHVEVLNKSGYEGTVRMNFLHPPFDNVKARQAMLYLVNQTDIVKATFGNPKYYGACPALFGCGNAMTNDENTGWFKQAPDFAKARQLFRESGYDGRPVVILQPTDLPVLNNAAQFCAQWLKQIGVNAQLATSDWGGVVTRRANNGPPEKGGWNILCTWTSGAAIASPIIYGGHAANGINGWWGWPANDEHERLRLAWAQADTTAQRLTIAKQMQRNAWDWVPQVYFGTWQQPQAWRSNVRGFLAVPELIPFWNVEKT